MIWYSLLQVIAMLLLFEYATPVNNWKDKCIFCLLVLFPIIPIIMYICYGIYSIFKK